MDYDFRNRANPPYDSHSSIYRPNSSSSPSNHPMYGPSSLYPRVGQPAHAANPPPSRHPSFQLPPTSSTSPGFGIRVSIKPEYRITPPPQLSHVGDIPRSTFQFDFDLEKRILAEAEKENQNWSRLGLENFPSKPAESSTSSLGSNSDPVVSKYIASGLSREAVPFAVANYGDNPAKVREFVNGYTLLREMGFSSKNVAEALAMYDNDTDKALAYFLNNGT